MVRLAFDTAREANPDVRLVLNDFDLSEDYEHLVEECLDAGVQIDAIGLQTHMHQGFRGAEEIWERIEAFARFGLPIQLTETTPQGEARQAEELVEHYTTVFSHPATESLTYWGITDHGAWLGAPCGLLRKDGSAKPGYDAIRDLIKSQWWHAPTEVGTDAEGGIRVDGFAGRYRISTPEGSVEVDLEHGDNTVTVDLADA